MKTRVHLRVARDKRGRGKVVATLKPTDTPLYDGGNDALPTVAFAIDLDVPDVMFSRAAQVIASITIPEEQATIAADVVERP